MVGLLVAAQKCTMRLVCIYLSMCAEPRGYVLCLAPAVFTWTESRSSTASMIIRLPTKGPPQRSFPINVRGERVHDDDKPLPVS
ncbi:unnamed protein product [Enterobius vermicularis]|uniref:Secreted protein n=1 Tax=Enterobius vermicularis TaxID=51028 RepID=A0A0N4UWI3_ENTVE|nr:unnamed protein product [Enterobius vermicularis]